ncbi:MAG: hypothetical protein ACP5OO_06865 [Chloroflexia bacterium]
MAESGSSCYELWGLEARTGALRWRQVLQGEGWLDEMGAGHGDSFTGRLAPRGVVVLHLLTRPARIAVETLDLRSGESPARVKNVLSEDFALWEGVAWAGDAAWVSTGHLYAVDLGTGRVLWGWP